MLTLFAAIYDEATIDMNRFGFSEKLVGKLVEPAQDMGWKRCR